MDPARLAAEMAEEIGIRLSPERLRPTLDALGREALDIEDGGPTGNELVRHLIDVLTVKESYFMRQPESLRELHWGELLAGAMADGRSHVRVWSAACARGEEPYTLAMLASDAFGKQRPPVDVLGTDISETALAEAAKATFSARALRRLGGDAKRRFFEPGDERLTVASSLAALVRFKRHNLARDPIPPPGETRFDLIVCRNVLIYFEPFAIEHLVRGLPRALRAGGKLVLGTADRLCLTQESLRDLSGALVGGPPPQRLPRPLRERSSAPGRTRRPPRDTTDPALAGALRLADAGRLDEALRVASAVVEKDPMNAPAQFVVGTIELARGAPSAAVGPLRAAVYADAAFAVAAFQLGRAYDLLRDGESAQRAYRTALAHLEAGPSRYPWLLEDLEPADLAVACAARLARA